MYNPHDLGVPENGIPGQLSHSVDRLSQRIPELPKQWSIPGTMVELALAGISLVQNVAARHGSYSCVAEMAAANGHDALDSLSLLHP